MHPHSPLSDVQKIVKESKNKYPELDDLSADKFIESSIQNNPSLKQRLLAAGKATFIETIKIFFPVVGIAIESVKAYKNPSI